eukprot:CAMPEP_0197027770 /NCGR_PEP_ID=MMETSP1384-20130603/7644_1 /TAXON_ID=29189 /ORGANISM="Ammonia sp." /LENGTH=938 /DNA_ID=CAMNT_0042456673 /DNA_START=31 /DNA_END=2847 /DNA_ORIENTATION=+
MPLKLDVEKVLHGKSERVKCVDIHPSEPWILSALYSGNIFIWNYDTETIVRTFEVCEVPVRTARFIVRKNWLVCGTDDMHIRVYNYNTCEKIKEFEAHTDYIRCIAVHPTLPFILSASDDMSIKLWDWDNQWENSIIFEGHTHYVMQIAINPKDSNSFASASLDRSVKVWGLNSSVPHFQLEGHERGVNTIAYYGGGERPFLVSGADDNLVKVWDYQTKTCIATLEGHTANISAVLFHPTLPIIISGSEDGSIKIWHSSTYRLETTLHYGMERVWALSSMQTSNKVAIGFDEGTIMIKLGQEEPIVSMDSSGKVVWAKNHEIQLTKIMKGKSFENIIDGEQLQVSTDDLGSCEFYPNYLKHNKNSQLIAICGDGEYTIYTSLRLKHKSFGQGEGFAWSSVSSDVYATKQSSTKIKIYKSFKEYKSIRTAYTIQCVFDGHLLGVKSNDDIYFYHWDTAVCIRRIEVSPNNIYWTPDGSSVAMVCADNYYILRYNEEIVDKYLSNNISIEEHGIETAFDLEQDINEVVTSGCYNNDVFIYTNANQRLNYYIGGQVITLVHLDRDRTFYVLGYIQKANRVYLIDKQHNIISYQLLRYVLAYQAAIVKDDLRTANLLIEKKKIEPKYFNKLAIFLEGQGRTELALKVSTDPEHKFELALSLKKLNLAKQILLKSPSQQKWKQLADLALRECDFITVEEAALNANDLSLLYLLYTSTNNKKGLQHLVDLAKKDGKFNVAFNTLFYLGDIKQCIDLLMENEKIPHAAMLARAYYPQKIPEITQVWKEKLKAISPSAANALGTIETHPEAFPPPVDELALPVTDDVDEQYEEQGQDEDGDDEKYTQSSSKQSSPPRDKRKTEEPRQDSVDEHNPDVGDEENEEEEEEEDEAPMVTTAQRQSADEAEISDVSLPSGMEDDVDNGEDHGNDENTNDDDFNIDDLDNI